jgi:hypothetical protein
MTRYYTLSVVAILFRTACYCSSCLLSILEGSIYLLLLLHTSKDLNAERDRKVMEHYWLFWLEHGNVLGLYWLCARASRSWNNHSLTRVVFCF